MTTSENYKGYVIVLEEKERRAILVGKVGNPILLTLNSSMVAVPEQFPELQLPDDLVLHGWYTEKTPEDSIQEIKYWIDAHDYD